MKFAACEGATARPLAVLAPGWSSRDGDRDASATSFASAAQFSAAESDGADRPVDGGGGSDSHGRTTTAPYEQGEEIFAPGEGRGLVYIVRSGCVRLSKALPDGRSIGLGLLGPDAVFTQEIDPDGLSSGTSAVAVVDSTVSVVADDDLVDLIAHAPELATAVVHGTMRRVSELQTLIEHLLARDTSVRLATTLLALARGFGQPAADGLTAIALPLTHQQLANMIGSNRVTVTRKMLQLQAAGVVRSLGRNSLAVSQEKLLSHARAARETALDS